MRLSIADSSTTAARRLSQNLYCAALVTALACGAPQGADLDVAPRNELVLLADNWGALQEEHCLAAGGTQSCSSYPNPIGCERMRIAIGARAQLRTHCHLSGESRALSNSSPNIPIDCLLRAERGNCVQCFELYGRLAFDGCDGEPGFRSEAFAGVDSFRIQQTAVRTGKPSEDIQQLAPHPGSGLVDDNVAQVQAGPTASSDSICVARGRQAYVDRLNKHLVEEGFQMRFTLAARQSADAAANPPISATRATGACRALGETDSCDPTAALEGRCFCSDHSALGPEASSFAGRAMCRCPRMNHSALRLACGDQSTDCPSREFGQGLLEAKRAADLWLARETASSMNQIADHVVDSIAEVRTPEQLVCLGTPLVLDLHGDGIALSAPERGVRFDLAGVGGPPRRSSWIDGRDDALLAIDRNENGTIDDGSELFGEAPTVGGAIPTHGFAALAILDHPSHGGNGDRMVDAADRLFGKLLLWHDRNKNGQSEPSEMTPLAATNIVRLSTSGVQRSGQFDQHGNDLGFRGRFVRRDGTSGSLVDVYLRY